MMFRSVLLAVLCMACMSCSGEPPQHTIVDRELDRHRNMRVDRYGWSTTSDGESYAWIQAKDKSGSMHYFTSRLHMVEE